MRVPNVDYFLVLLLPLVRPFIPAIVGAIAARKKVSTEQVLLAGRKGAWIKGLADQQDSQPTKQAQGFRLMHEYVTNREGICTANQSRDKSSGCHFKFKCILRVCLKPTHFVLYP